MKEPVGEVSFESWHDFPETQILLARSAGVIRVVMMMKSVLSLESRRIGLKVCDLDSRTGELGLENFKILHAEGSCRDLAAETTTAGKGELAAGGRMGERIQKREREWSEEALKKRF